MAREAPGPVAVLRGATADVQCVSFVRSEHGGGALLLSGDAEGGVRLWDVARRRTAAEAPAAHAGAGSGTLAVAELEHGAAARCVGAA